MITITPLAQEKLSAYLAENKVDPKVRIYLPECDCSGAGAQISLALDQPEAGDLTAVVGDLELFMARELHDLVGDVVIDFKDDGQSSGFVVESERPAPSAAPSGCGGGCSCCG